MLKLNPRVVTRNGRNEYVMLPWKEYVAVCEAMEDWEDLLALQSAKRENKGKPGVPIEDVIKRYRKK